MIHYFKTWPEPFEALAIGTKTHEIRKDDRTQRPRPGDMIVLREWEPAHRPGAIIEYDSNREDAREVAAIAAAEGEYTGRELRFRVTYITQPGAWGLPADLYVMSVRLEP